MERPTETAQHPSTCTAAPRRPRSDRRRRRWTLRARGALALCLAVGIGACHLGRPPAGPTGGGVQLVPVAAPVAEPDLPDAVARGLSRGLAARGVASDGPRLEVEVLDAQVVVVGATGLRRVHRARLVLAFRLRGADPRDVVLRAERSYEVGTGDGLAAAEARSVVFAQLAEELAADLAAWLALAPARAPAAAPLDSEAP